MGEVELMASVTPEQISMDGDVVRGMLSRYDAETIAIWIRQYVSFDVYGRKRMEESMRKVADRG